MRAAFTIVPAVLLAACATVPAGGAAASAVDDPESYAVYGTVIRGTWPVTDAKATRLVIRRDTVRDPRCRVSGLPVEGEWKGVLAAFDRENAGARELRPGFPMQPPYVLASRDEIQQTFSNPPDGDWSGFYQRFPESGGYFEVSAVGFDEGRTRAMVYVAYHCNNLCGGGQMYLLEKAGSSWREVRPEGLERCLWMS